MAVVRVRSKRRPQGGRGGSSRGGSSRGGSRGSGPRGAFPRRLTWCEIEAIFDHFFAAGTQTPEAQRAVLRFRRSRTQILPIFSWMVVSPYERERLLALDLLDRIGGRSTLQMIEDLLGDIDVYEAFKLDLQRLKESLAARVSAQPDDDEEREDEDEDDGAAAEGAEDGQAAGPAPAGRRPRPRSRRRGERAAETELETATESESESESDAERPAGRGRPAPKGRGGAQPTALEDDDDLLGKPGEAFLRACAGPIEPLLEAFAEMALDKRVSFVDRLARIDDPRLVGFLGALLTNPERALVQSALRAIAALGRVEALPALEEFLAAGPPRGVRGRAEQVRQALLAAAPAAEAAQPANEEPAAGPAPRSRRRRRSGGRSAETVEAVETSETGETPAAPAPRPRPARPAESAKRESAAEALGLVLPAVEPLAPITESLTIGAHLPRLHNCLAGGQAADGSQRFAVYRAGAEGTIERLTLLVGADGWLGASHQSGLPPDIDRRDRAADAGWVEATVGYVRTRLQQAAAINADLQRPLPREASAALAYLGSGRRTEDAEELPTAPVAVSQAAVETLLDHPVMAGWRLELRPGGQALRQWLATRGRRSASRQRKLLIDEVVGAWLGLLPPAELAARLRRQALLLRRAEAEAEADTALAGAALLLTGKGLDHPLAREIAYRAFAAGVAGHREQRRRGERRPTAVASARALSRSPGCQARRVRARRYR
jgi:hypothetical protein